MRRKSVHGSVRENERMSGIWFITVRRIMIFGGLINQLTVHSELTLCSPLDSCGFDFLALGDTFNLKYQRTRPVRVKQVHPPSVQWNSSMRHVHRHSFESSQDPWKRNTLRLDPAFLDSIMTRLTISKLPEWWSFLISTIGLLFESLENALGLSAILGPSGNSNSTSNIAAW